MPRFYLDLRAHRESHADGQTPWTPAIAVVFQVDEGLRLMTAEGADGVFARHEACAAATRAGLAALGFELFADPRHASQTVTAARRPGRPRLEGVQRRAQAPRPRPRRRPGQADRQDLPARPPRLGHARGDPRRDRAPSRSSRSQPGRPVEAGRRGRGRPGRGRSSRTGIVDAGRRRGRRVRILVAEPLASEGVELLRAAPRGRRAHRAVAATSCARSCPTTTR